MDYCFWCDLDICYNFFFLREEYLLISYSNILKIISLWGVIIITYVSLSIIFLRGKTLQFWLGDNENWILFICLMNFIHVMDSTCLMIGRIFHIWTGFWLRTFETNFPAPRCSPSPAPLPTYFWCWELKITHTATKFLTSPSVSWN